MAELEIIKLDDGFATVKREGIDPFINCIENNEREFFRAKEFVKLYDLIFKMCIQRDPYNWSEAMYEKYTQSILNYLLDRVQPAMDRALKTNYDVALLKEWKQRWANQKLIVTGLSKLFMYLDRFYTPNCFPAIDHEILTNAGFLSLTAFKERAVMDQANTRPAGVAPLLVACYRNQSKELEFLSPVRLVEAIGNHSLVEFVSNPNPTKRPTKTGKLMQAEQIADVSIAATANHNMWVAISKLNTCPLSSGLQTGAEGKYHSMTANVVAQLAAEEGSLVKLSARAENGVKMQAIDVSKLPFAKPLGLTTADHVDAFLWLYGCFCGDGFMHFTDSNRYIGFKLVTGADVTELDRVLARLPVPLLPPIGSACDRVDCDGYTRSVEGARHYYRIYHPAWFNYFARQYWPLYAGGKQWWDAQESKPNTDIDAASITDDTADTVLAETSAAEGIARMSPDTETAERIVGNADLPNHHKSAKWFYYWAWKCPVLTRDQIRILFAGLRFADGSKSRQQDKENVPMTSISTSSVRFRDELVVMALLAGFSTFVSVHSEKGAERDVNEPGTVNRDAIFHWRVHYSEAARTAEPMLHGPRDISRRDWTGTVWCVEVPTPEHLIVVRRIAQDGTGRPFKPVIVGNTDGIHALKEQGFKLYKENVFDHYHTHAARAILHAIEKERANEQQDRHLLQEAVNVFVEMGYNYGGKKLTIYTEFLEKPLIAHAGEHYKRQSREWLDQDSAPVYMDKVEKVLQSERARVEAYLNRCTIEPLHKECYQQMLKEHLRELLSKKTGIAHLLSLHALDDLSRMYRLYKGNDSELTMISEMLGEHIQQAGMEVVDKARPQQAVAAKDGDEADQRESKEKEAADGKTDEKSEEKAQAQSADSADANHALVRNLIALHAQYNEIVMVCFEKAQIMQKALKKAFEDFINKDNRVSKLLAKFVNDVLRKGSKVNVKDIESTLDNVVFLYGYIQEKDVFERDYQSYLANRLLHGLCESEHSEKSMIAKLKTECGYQWTNKLEGMFKDVQLSKEMMQQFRHLNGGTSATTSEDEIALEVNVCTTGYWPSTKITPCHMPKDLHGSCEKYKRFYLNKHSGHKLEWRFDQGSAEVSVDFHPQCRKGLVVTTYQMMILLLFNQQKFLSYKEMVDMTGIPRSEIANHLLSLCHPKVAVLKKNPNNKKLEDSNKFMLNPQYKNPLKKINVPLMRASEEQDSGEEENKAIELQRRHQMDAAIVRIMKTRKTLRHNLLVAEVISQLSARFRPKPNDIKKRIEALIEQEYMTRDDKERGVYNYLA